MIYHSVVYFFVILCYWVGLVAGFTGDASLYDLSHQKTACGNLNPEAHFVAAAAIDPYGDYPHAICGKNVRVTYQKRTITLTIVNVCTTCDRRNDIAVSPFAFSALTGHVDDWKLPAGIRTLEGVDWDYTGMGPGLFSDTNKQGKLKKSKRLLGLFDEILRTTGEDIEDESGVDSGKRDLEQRNRLSGVQWAQDR